MGNAKRRSRASWAYAQPVATRWLQGAGSSEFDTGLTREKAFAILGGRTKVNGTERGKRNSPSPGRKLFTRPTTEQDTSQMLRPSTGGLLNSSIQRSATKSGNLAMRSMASSFGLWTEQTERETRSNLLKRGTTAQRLVEPGQSGACTRMLVRCFVNGQAVKRRYFSTSGMGTRSGGSCPGASMVASTLPISRAACSFTYIAPARCSRVSISKGW